MAEKRSFVMYTSWATMMAGMPEEQAGQLIKAICAYQIGIEYTPADPTVNAVFSMILMKMQEDAESYEDSCKKKSENAKKRWNDAKPMQKDAKDMQKDAKACTCIKEECKPMQMDGDTESDSDTDTETDKEKRLLKPSTKVSAQSDLFDHSEPQADVEAIPLNDGSEWRPTQAEYEEYCRLYPAVDVKSEIAGMRAWSLSNPKNKKTKNGVKRFLNGWLSKEQNKPHRGRDKPSGSAYLDRIDHRLDIVDQWGEAVGAYGGGQDDGSTVYPFG